MFIQYLDCVRQLMIQFPQHFEYNHELLLFIADEMYTHKFGNFLGNCDYDRQQMRINDHTESMWTYVMLEKGRFTNRYYNPEATRGIIEQIPLTAPICLQEWRELLFKWSTNGYNRYHQHMHNTELVQKSYQAIQLENTKE